MSKKTYLKWLVLTLGLIILLAAVNIIRQPERELNPHFRIRITLVMIIGGLGVAYAGSWMIRREKQINNDPPRERRQSTGWDDWWEEVWRDPDTGGFLWTKRTGQYYVFYVVLYCTVSALVHLASWLLGMYEL